MEIYIVYSSTNGSLLGQNMNYWQRRHKDISEATEKGLEDIFGLKVAPRRNLTEDYKYKLNLDMQQV